MPVNIKKSNSLGGSGNNKFIFPAKVKKIILDGSEEGKPTDLTSAEKWGGYDAVGLIFYNKVQKLPQTSPELNLDESEKEDIDKWDGFAKPLFSFQKYYPLINEVVLIISATSKDYLEDRRSVHDYYFPVLNLWNHPHHNTLPAVQNYQDLSEEEQSEIYKSEEYAQAGLLRRVLDGELDIDIPLGKYFKEQLNIHPLLPYEGDLIFEGRFGNSIRFGATARADEEVIPEQNKNKWSNGTKGDNGDPITLIRNGQSPALDEQGWIHTTEDINFDPSSIYLTSNQKIDSFIVASDAWNTFGLNASIPQNDQNEAQKIIDNPAESVQDKEIEVDKIESPKNNQEKVNQGQQSKQQEQEQTGSIDYEKQEQEVSGSLTTSGSLDTETSGSISEEEAGLEEEEDTTEYYQLDDGQTEPEAIERPPLPESYYVSTMMHDNCGGCTFHENNYCNKWGAKVRGNHSDPWLCDAYEEKIIPAWTKVPNSTRKGRGGKTASIYKYYTRNTYDGAPKTVFHLVGSTEEGVGTLDENGHANYSKIKSQVDYISMFPFAYRGSRGWKGFNEAEGKTPQDFLLQGVNLFTRLVAESDVVDMFYQYVNWGKAGDDKSTWPYTILNQQIFDPKENYNKPVYVEAFIKDKDYEKDTSAGRQTLTEKAKVLFLKELKKIDRELINDFEITLDEGYFKKFTKNYDLKKKTHLKCSFKIINLKDKYSG